VRQWFWRGLNALDWAGLRGLANGFGCWGLKGFGETWRDLEGFGVCLFGYGAEVAVRLPE